MSLELLNDDHRDLKSSDIFSLGCTVYEVCLGRELPANGQEWQDIRSGILKDMDHVPVELQGMIKEMLSADPTKRPTASALLARRQLMSESEKQLQIEKNTVLHLNNVINNRGGGQEAVGGGGGGQPPCRLKRAQTWQG